MEKKLVKITIYVNDKYHKSILSEVFYEIKNNKFYVLGFTKDETLCQFGNSIIKNDIIGKYSEISVVDINNVTKSRLYNIKNTIKINDDITVKYSLEAYNDFFYGKKA